MFHLSLHQIHQNWLSGINLKTEKTDIVTILFIILVCITLQVFSTWIMANLAFYLKKNCARIFCVPGLYVQSTARHAIHLQFDISLWNKSGTMSKVYRCLNSLMCCLLYSSRPLRPPHRWVNVLKDWLSRRDDKLLEGSRAE
jgi:hypothetical protein